MSKCQCKTSEGKRCRRNTDVNSKFCWQHSPKPRGVGCKKTIKNNEKSKKLSRSSSSQMESFSKLENYISENNGHVSFDDVTVYDWIKSNFGKYKNMDTSQPIQVAFDIYGQERTRKKKKQYGLFIGSKDGDDNMHISKTTFSKALSNFLKEAKNTGKDNLHISVIIEDGENEGEKEFNSINELLKFVA